MTARLLAPALLVVLLALAPAAEKYTGPRPPKPDLPFLLHASKLVPTEPGEAKEEKRKNDMVYVVDGASSSARTPLAEPIFLLEAQKLVPQKFELYRLEVRNGRREVVFPEKKKNAPRPYILSVTSLAEGLYRLEASQGLENGEYALTPAGSNHVFCFQVY